MSADLKDTEAGSETVPWPVDFGPREPESEKSLPEGATHASVLAVLLAVFAVALLAALAGHVVARWPQ